MDRGHCGLQGCFGTAFRRKGAEVGATGGDLAGGDCGPAAQAHEHLLAVVQQSAIAKLLERARSLGQHAYTLPWCR